MHQLLSPRLLLIGVALVAIVIRGSAASDWTVTIEPLASPAAGESGQPQLSVSDRGAIVSWIERNGATAVLKFARLRQGSLLRQGSGAQAGEQAESRWSEPRTVATGDNWFVNWADVPSVVQLADGAFAAHWLQKSGPGSYAYDVRLSFSKDDGKTWSASTTPHHDGTQTEHGFASLVSLPGAKGSLGLVWLDGRAMTGGGHGGHGGGGSMGLRFGSFDRDGKQVSESVVDDRVCECCPTAAVATPDGMIAAYRDRGADEVRDIYVVRLENGKWSQPAPVHADNWRIPACPVNGPALSARDRNVAIAWYTMKNEKGHAQAAFSSDGGRSFGAPVAVADADTVGRVDIALLEDGSAVASWIETTAAKQTEFKVRRIQANGTKSPSITVAQLESGRVAGYPRIAVHGNELLFAWVARENGLRVKTAVARLPRT